MAKLSQLGLLLWKNYLLQKRKVLVTILEIALPAFFSFVLILVRQRVDAQEYSSPTTWSNFSVRQLPDSLCPQLTLLGSCDRPWQLYYYPNTSDHVNSIMARVHNRLTPSIRAVVGYSNESQMISDIVADLERGRSTTNYISDILGAIVFSNPPTSYEDSGHSAQNITYQIRLSSSPRGKKTPDIFATNEDLSWKTGLMFPLFQLVGPREASDKTGGDPGYYREGFLSLQHNIDHSIIQDLSNGSVSYSELDVVLRRFPYPPYVADNFVLVTQQQLPFIIMLSFIFVALNIVKDVVIEKERKLKESMKMMGLSNWLHWMAWFIKYFVFLLISVIIMTIFYSAPISSHGSVIGRTDPTVLLVFLMAYAVATISFCFMLSTFFKKANSAAAAGGILFVIAYIPYFFLQPRYDSLSWGTKMATSLISNVAMAFGAQVIGMFEGTGAGVQWSTINRGATVDDTFTMVDVLVMLLLDAVVYAVITWYVEAVFPGEFGIPQPWYFPVKRSYWCGSRQKVPDSSTLHQSESTPLLMESSSSHDSGYFEREPSSLRPGIEIQNLRKEFANGAKKNVAVAGMNLNMYEGQITALLGHNGAGKTTTMSMLTGFFPPTSGTAVVNGYDIQQNISGVRESLGLCPQHNVLFDTLTVEEHLNFFVKLKGYPKHLVDEEVNRMIAATGLNSKRKAQSKTLSGGMKRKLSVGIALIGDSKVVILDEPTSGMDPNARRHTWDLLQQHRQGRTLVLSTHFMDEADVLGDRIAIMADGVIQCCGTPLFLKKKYGAGYHMVIVKQPGCDVNVITDLVRLHVPNAQLESNVSAELSYVLPHESKDKFEVLFTEIEQQKEQLGIASYGASVTTMEEVFLRVGENAEDLRRRLQQSSDQSLSTGNTLEESSTRPGPCRSYTASQSVNSSACHSSGQAGFGSVDWRLQSVTPTNNYLTSAFNRDMTKNTGVLLYMQQFYGMFMKRVLHTMRNWLVTVSQMVVPLFFTIMALIVVKTLPGPQDAPPLLLDMSHFGYNYIVYGSGRVPTNASQHLAETYESQFSAYPSSQLIYLNNQTHFNNSMEDYLISVGEYKLSTYNNHYLIAVEFEDGERGMNATAHFNNEGYHTTAMSLNALDNTLLRNDTGTNHTLYTTNYPLPRTLQEKIDDQFTQGFEGFTIAFNVMLGMAFLASSFVLFLVKERTIKAKHSQFVSGVQPVTFWSSTFSWDLINYLVPCLALLIVFAAFKVEAYIGENRIWMILLLLLLYGWAVLPSMYLLSFLFKVPSTGMVWLTMLNILSGVATVLAVQILRIPGLNTLTLSKTLEWIFLILLPNFCLGQGLNDFYSNYQFLNICQPILSWCEWAPALNLTIPCCKGHCGEMCVDFNSNYLSVEPGGIGRMLIFLAVQGFLYFSLLLLLESHLFQTLWYGMTQREPKPGSKRNRYMRLPSMEIAEDSDVTQERLRVNSTPLQTLLHKDSLLLQELSKSYGSLLAVDGLSVGIPQGECFGLLGINGAGKTSTFQMLTGDELVSAGNAYLGGYDIKTDMTMVRRQLGYCPQFDALIDQLTGRETLIMYARLRGVPESLIPSVVNDLIYALVLQKHADKLVASYSGGNKRKLSTAVSMVGDPPVLFLDEPTTGVDPVARRLMWDTLSKVRASGRTLVLTSHSMEECEALCTRIAIMVNGQFKCLGSTQHLKTKFGEGFTLMAKVGYPDDGDEPPVEPLMDFISTTFPGSILKDLHQGLVHFHITDASIPWAKLFGTMEAAKARFNIEDYSVSQTSLEQVFINFARSQVPPLEAEQGCCGRCGVLCGSCCCCCSCAQEQEMTLVVEGDASNATTHS